MPREDLGPASSADPPAQVPAADLAPASPAAVDASDDGHPLTPTEEIVAGAWQRALSRPVGRAADFFKLGGDSLAAAVVTRRLARVFRVPLDLTLIFDNTQLTQYAAVIDRIRREASGLEAEEFVVVDRAGDIPLSLLQENRLLREVRALAAGRRDAPMIVALAVQIDGAIEDRRIVAALNDVIAAHEPLRTAFHLDPATESVEPFIVASATAEVEYVSAEEHPASQRLALLHRLLRELVQDPMALDRPPLLRSRLVRFGAEDRVLLLAVEHLVLDGWSIELVVSSLAAALSGTARAALAPRLQYADWASWQRRQLSGATLDRLLEYWRTRLAGTQPFAPLELPPPRTELASLRREASAELSAVVLGRLRATGQATGTTLFMLVLTAVVAAWQRCTGSGDIVVHSPTANRGRPETEDIVGWLAHSVVLRFNPGEDIGWRAYLAHVRDRVLDALLHQDLPAPLLIKALQPERHGNPRRAARLFFVLEPSLAAAHHVPGGVLRQLRIEDVQAVAQPGLSFTARVTEGGGLALQVIYDQAEVEASFVTELAEQVGRGLLALAESDVDAAANGGGTAPSEPAPSEQAPSELAASKSG